MDCLCRYDGNKIVTYYSDNSDYSLINHRPRRLHRDSIGNIWISFSTTSEVCKYNYDTDNFSRFDFDSISPTLQDLIRTDKIQQKSFLSEDKKTEWELVRNRIFRRDIKNDALPDYYPKHAELGSLSDSYITAIYLDDCGILWVGTDNGGVHFADTNRKGFRHYVDVVRESVGAISEDVQANIWIGTRNSGVLRMNKDRKNAYPFPYRDIGQGDGSMRVRELFSDSKGNMWIGTRNGLYLCKYGTDTVLRYTRKTKPAIPHSWVYAINEDSNGLVWIGTWDGLTYYDYSNDTIVSLGIVDINAIRGIAIGKDGLWIGTEKGLVNLSYNYNNGKLSNIETKYFHHSANKNTLLNDFIYSLDVDIDGNIWIGTARGLCMYDILQKEFKSFPEIEYIAETGILGVLCYKENVWLCYGRGLSRINRKSYKARHYDKLDGLQDNEFSEDAYYKSNSGELFFGGNNGINSFFPDSIVDNTNPPKIVFTGLKVQHKRVAINEEVNGSVILKKPLMKAKGIELTHKHRNFEIEFTALHFSNPAKNTYAYKLEGFDDDWTYTASERNSVIYSGLTSGEYTLMVKAANSDGVWNDTPIKLDIKILAPWWATLYAYISYALLCILLAYLIMQNIIAKKNKEHQKELEQVKAEFADEKFINQAKEVVNKHISDNSFSPDVFAQEMAVSRAQLFRKIKAISNQTVSEFISEIRLNKAAELLKVTNKQVGEISVECGFSDASNFRRSFIKKFGLTPSKFRK